MTQNDPQGLKSRKTPTQEINSPSTLASLESKIVHLLTRNKIISHLVSTSEIYAAL